MLRQAVAIQVCPKATVGAAAGTATGGSSENLPPHTHIYLSSSPALTYAAVTWNRYGHLKRRVGVRVRGWAG